jgi:acetyl-CoA synthetase
MTSSAYPTHLKEYREQYRNSCEHRAAFWEGEARGLLWLHPFSTVFDETGAWFADGRLNACENALDRHVREGLGERTAIVEIGDTRARSRTPSCWRASSRCPPACWISGWPPGTPWASCCPTTPPA